MERVSFGVRLPVAGPLASTESIKTVATTSETLGYDAVWLHDFIVWTKHLDRVHLSCGSAEAVDASRALPTFYEALTTLSFVAGSTSHVQLGIAVLNLPVRDPIITAKQIATVDHLSGGRLILGVGVGAPPSIGSRDFEVLRVPRVSRYRRAEDYIRAMRVLWAGGEEYEGEFTSFTEAPLSPRPIRGANLPIWFGGSGRKALQLAGELGNGWIPGRIAASGYPALRAQIDAAADQAGRNLGDEFTVAADIFACLAESDQEAIRKASRTIETLTARGGFATTDGQGSFGDSALIGGPAEVRERVRRYADAGVTHFEMKFIYPSIEDLLAQLHLFAYEVIPHFHDVIHPA